MDQEISLSRVKLYLHNISLWNSAKNYSNFFFKLSTAVNPEEYFNTYQTYFQLFPTVKSALHAVLFNTILANHICVVVEGGSTLSSITVPVGLKLTDHEAMRV
jgi:hypothetical protein